MGKPVIGGGPLFTRASEESFQPLDLVLGEVEEIMPRVVADMEAGCLGKLYQREDRPDVNNTHSSLGSDQLEGLRDHVGSFREAVLMTVNSATSLS